jgi:hypothetical protein
VYTLETGTGIKAIYIYIYILIVVRIDGKKYITDNEPQRDTEISIKYISDLQIAHNRNAWILIRCFTYSTLYITYPGGKARPGRDADHYPN